MSAIAKDCKRENGTSNPNSLGSSHKSWPARYLSAGNAKGKTERTTQTRSGALTRAGLHDTCRQETQKGKRNKLPELAQTRSGALTRAGLHDTRRQETQIGKTVCATRTSPRLLRSSRQSCNDFLPGQLQHNINPKIITKTIIVFMIKKILLRPLY